MSTELVVFTMNNCPYCKKLKEHLEAESVDYSHFNIHESEEAQAKADEYGINRFPTLLVTQGGTIIDVKVGFDENDQTITEYLKTFE